MSRFDPVAFALQRRKEAAVCLICGAKFIIVKGKRACMNEDDGRHARLGRRKLRVKVKK